MRGLSEFYAALILLAITALLAPKIASMLSHADTRPAIEPLMIITRVNESHAVCITTTSWSPMETLSEGDFTFWVFSQDLDGDGLLEPIPGSYNDTIEAGTYVLVSPPWPCR